MATVTVDSVGPQRRGVTRTLEAYHQLDKGSASSKTSFACMPTHDISILELSLSHHSRNFTKPNRTLSEWRNVVPCLKVQCVALKRP